jgi:eukaryotic-like serine/threonine-protein kinase
VAEIERKEERYGPFDLLEPLGVGAMATVHRGVERGASGFERDVALKRLLPHLAQDAEFVRGFVRDAKLASLLHHGNIVQLYELGRVGTSYFVAMEYVKGRDLRVILRQARRVCGPPPIEVAVALIAQLLDALDYAHGLRDADGDPLGLLHRDISPANLIVSDTGHLKLIDFGMARATFGQLMAHPARIKGKLAYMAPETLAGRRLDARSDLFSTSIIAHELLTATPLFAAREDHAIIDRLQHMQPPPPSTRNPICPAELDRIVLRGLAVDPDRRWQSAAEMRAALAQLAVERKLVATNREVAKWIEEAFREPAPGRSARLRLPLPPPPRRPADKRSGGTDGEPDDEVVDIVWGASAPHSMPVVVDGVPDMSLEPTVPAASTEAQTRPGRVRPPSPDMLSAMWTAQQAQAMVMAAPAPRRRPLLPFIVAAVGVIAAGAALAWLLSLRPSQPRAVVTPLEPAAPLAQPTPPGATAPTRAPVAAPQSAPAPSPPPQSAPAPAAVAPAPGLVDHAGESAGHSDRAGAGRGPDEPGIDRGSERDERRVRRARARRDRIARREERKRGEKREPEAAPDPPDAPEPTRDVLGAEPIEAQVAVVPSGETLTAVEPREPALHARPAPAATRADTTRAAALASARPAGPIIVSASRAQLESGNEEPMRFPHGHDPPARITAKLCVDSGGAVTSVTVLSSVSAKIRRTVERELSQWRYRPVVDGGNKVAACFATAFPVQRID